MGLLIAHCLSNIRTGSCMSNLQLKDVNFLETQCNSAVLVSSGVSYVKHVTCLWVAKQASAIHPHSVIHSVTAEQQQKLFDQIVHKSKRRVYTTCYLLKVTNLLLVDFVPLSGCRISLQCSFLSPDLSAFFFVWLLTCVTKPLRMQASICVACPKPG